MIKRKNQLIHLFLYGKKGSINMERKYYRRKSEKSWQYRSAKHRHQKKRLNNNIKEINYGRL